MMKISLILNFFELLITGLQEYVEALSFYHHLKHGEMISWDQGMIIIFQYLSLIDIFNGLLSFPMFSFHKHSLF